MPLGGLDASILELWGTICGSGFVVSVSADPGPLDDNWEVVAWMSFGLSASSITAAELEAVAAARYCVAAHLENSGNWKQYFEHYHPWNYEDSTAKDRPLLRAALAL